MKICKALLYTLLALLFISGCSGTPKEGAKPKDEGIKPPPAKTGEAAPQKKKTVQELVVQLNTTTGAQRQEANDELRKIGKEAVPQIIPMLDDLKPETRLNAAVALGVIGPPDADSAIPRLQELATKDPDEKVRTAAANSVKQIQTRL